MNPDTASPPRDRRAGGPGVPGPRASAALAALPPFATTGIGSLPHADPRHALAELAAADLDVPYWPQLPRRSFLETMVPQAARPMPFLRVDEAARRVTAVGRDERPARLAEAWERILAGDAARFAPSGAEAAAWGPFLAGVAARPAVKGQLTGPVTLGLGAADDDGRPIFFDAELREAAVRATAAAARRQTEMLGAARRLAIVSADEPTLAVLGAAAYLGVAPDDAREALAAVLAAIREAGGVPAVHCCGAADWEIPIAAGAEVIFADTFGYGASLAAAAAAVRGLLERGGRIGWGAVPTDEARVGATVSGMLDRWREAEEALARAGIDRGTLRRQSLLTPACGCGSLEIGAARRVFEDLRALRERLRSDLGCR